MSKAGDHSSHSASHVNDQDSVYYWYCVFIQLMCIYSSDPRRYDATLSLEASNITNI